MFVLQKQYVNQVELENGTVFEDIFYKKVFQAPTKQEIRQFISTRYKDKGQFRMIAPGGAMSDPMRIKLQDNNGNKPKPERYTKDRLMYRLTDDCNPIIIPPSPRGRMRFIAKALREQS